MTEYCLYYIKIFIAICLCLYIPLCKNQNPLDYSEKSWPLTCRGFRQSPINLTRNLENCEQTNDISIINSEYNKIVNPIINVTDDKQHLIIKQNNMGSILFSKYGYVYKYILNYIEVKAPTEHTIDGTYGDLELQLVHYKDTTYYNSTNTSYDSDTNTKWLIISLIFVQFQDKESKLLNSIINFNSYFNYAKRVNQQNYTESRINSSALFPTINYPSYKIIDLNMYVKPNLMYFYYPGSFTSPSCEESVNWLIRNKFSYFSKKQKEYLTDIIGSYYPNGNNRGTKPLNGRKINLIYNNNFKIQEPLSESNSYLKSRWIFIIINFIFLLY